MRSRGVTWGGARKYRGWGGRALIGRGYRGYRRRLWEAAEVVILEAKVLIIRRKGQIHLEEEEAHIIVVQIKRM